MLVRFGRSTVLLVALAALFVVALNNPNDTFATSASAPNWLLDKTPALTRTIDLPDNVMPQLRNGTCEEKTYSSGSSLVTACVNDTAIGKLSTSSTIFLDDTKTLNVVAADGRSPIGALPGTNYLMTTDSSAASGSYLGIYTRLTRGDLEKQFINNGMFTLPRFRVTQNPDYWIKETSGKLLGVNTRALAVSGNNKWMVVDVPRVALVRINMDTNEILPFGLSPEASWFSGSANSNMAISNDGRYVAEAIQTTNGGSPGPNLTMYDLSTCSATFDAFKINKQLCKSHDLWRGYGASGAGKDTGIHPNFTGAKLVGNLQFADSGNLTFNVVHNWKSPQDFSADTYTITADGAALHKLGLLGVGDSYISGEGAHNYREGTDVPLNKCHLSKDSYPYLIGEAYFGSYESVACSGAKTLHIVGNGDSRTSGKQYAIHAPLNETSITRDLNPGYISQKLFLSEYLPQTVLLSIGGNDIGFADILKKCIRTSEDDSTCYPYYEDRLELARLINSKFNLLVETYKKIKSSSPGVRLYVVGYPEVVRPNGNCAVNVALNAEETVFARDLVDYLNAVVERAARKAGVFYVDAQSALYGHRLCEEKGKLLAVNGLTAGNDDGFPLPLKTKLYFLGKESYHPNKLGHELLRMRIATQTLGLSKPMPVEQPSLTAPGVDTNTALLLNAPKSGRPVYSIIPDDNLAADVVIKGQPTKVTVNGLQHNTKPSSSYSAVLYSNPVNLGTVLADIEGDISSFVTVPASVAPGYHTLHLYGKDMGDNAIDIQKVVYVAESYEDYDSDGVTNDQGACVIGVASGLDQDKDGTDDACDAFIDDAPTVIITPRQENVVEQNITQPEPIPAGTGTNTVQFTLSSIRTTASVPVPVTANIATAGARILNVQNSTVTDEISIAKVLGNSQTPKPVITNSQVKDLNDLTKSSKLNALYILPVLTVLLVIGTGLVYSKAHK